MLASAALSASGASAADLHASATVDVTVKGLRSSKGVLRLMICPPAADFPNCGTKAVRTATLPISNGEAKVRIPDLPVGTYAIGVFHDANANGKLDTMLGIPGEGYGFSRNPPFRPRAPRFDEAKITLEGEKSVDISLRYIW